jgi:hypothetical protein
MRASSAFKETEDESEFEFEDDDGNECEKPPGSAHRGALGHLLIEARRIAHFSPPIVLVLELELVLDPSASFF